MESTRSRLHPLMLAAFVAGSVALMVVDARSEWLQPLRAGMSWITQPIVLAATMPATAGRWLAAVSRTDDDIVNSLRFLERENLILRANLQKLESLEAENLRLHELLSASGPRSENAVLAELIEVSLEPFTHKIITNRGLRSGVYVGQAVIDTKGIMGQVTRVTPFTSAVTLITDPNHAIPVQIRRNGLRAIVYGVGTADRMAVPYLTPQSDVKNGDILVSSGMGGRFPAGYPVARVDQVVLDANEPFLDISASPVARLDYATQVLLLRPSDSADSKPESGLEGKSDRGTLNPSKPDDTEVSQLLSPGRRNQFKHYAMIRSRGF